MHVGYVSEAGWVGGLVLVVAVGCNGGDSNNETFGFDPPTTTGGTDASTNGPSTTGSDDTDEEDATSGSTSGGSDDTASDDTEGPEPDGVGALGTILLGESHPATGGTTLGVLSAAFRPWAPMAESCAMDVGGCDVLRPAVCQPVCAVDVPCVYDETCTPVCQVPCTLTCPEGQVCYNPSPDLTACREIERFDAGRLNFYSTNTPITLYPPYEIPGDITGALVTPNKEVRVTASGAQAAGFGPFEVMVTTTDSIFSTINTIEDADAFGTGNLQINWSPDTGDTVTISLAITTTTGVSTVTCTGDDSEGALTVPRTAIDAAIGEDTATTMAAAVQRTRTEATTGVPIVGNLLDQDAPAEGRVEFTYVSTETVTFTSP